MNSLTILLLVAAGAAVALWTGLSVYVFAVQRRRTATRQLLTRALDMLQRADAAGRSPAERRTQLASLLSDASRDLVMSAASRRDTPDTIFEALATYLIERWGRDPLLANASVHRSARDKWRRTTALRILSRLRDPAAFDLLARAIDETDEDVAGVALILLGRSTDPRAMDLLIGALVSQRHPASRVASHIEHSPQPVPERLRGLLPHEDAVVRLWAATLLAHYPNDAVESEVIALTQDPDSRVRKAAIQTLGRIGGDLSAESALRLMKDQFPYVRAHAVRALGELSRIELADHVAALLGDENWWVRLAAKESLEMMGSDVWPVLMRNLGHSDRFIRNGAAEVFQNLGVLDSLIVMEAASDNPAQTKIAMLRRIVEAGGAQFTESLVERAGPIVGPRIRQLVATMGLEHVEAH